MTLLLKSCPGTHRHPFTLAGPGSKCQLDDTPGPDGGPESLHSQSMEGPKEAAAGLLAALVTAKSQATMESQVAEGQHSRLSLYPPFLRYMEGSRN